MYEAIDAFIIFSRVSPHNVPMIPADTDQQRDGFPSGGSEEKEEEQAKQERDVFEDLFGFHRTLE